MSQKAKIIKPKKRFQWSKLWYYIKSLWSNPIALECGITKKWYTGVIIAVLSVLISAIPLCVHAATSEGGSFLSSSFLYNYDEGFYSFLTDTKLKNYSITFDNVEHTSKLTGFIPSASNDYLVYEHKYEANDGHATSMIDFQVFYLDSTIDYAAASKTIQELKVNSKDGRDASFIIFGHKYFTTGLYKAGTYTTSGGMYGNYNHITEDYTSLNDFFVTENSTRIENKAASIKKFQLFLNDVYIDNRNSLTFVQTGIILAVNASIILLMGLVLFLMTRGKNNPNRTIKFQQAFNISYWSSLSPAILALIIGFIFTGYEVMLFVVIFGFRIMWLSMKALAPGAPQSK